MWYGMEVNTGSEWRFGRQGGEGADGGYRYTESADPSHYLSRVQVLILFNQWPILRILHLLYALVTECIRACT